MPQPFLKTIRVLIADDHTLLREGFRNMLGRHEEFQFVGEAENGRELVDLAIATKPDIIFTDITMPLMDGIEATGMISRECPDTGIIALTNFDEDHLIIAMLEAGAKGYLVKSAAKTEIIKAAHVVFDHGTYYCGHTSSRMLRMIAGCKFNPYKISKAEFNDREKEVIKLVCQEYSNKQMAAIMNLSMRTVEGYREKIQDKMKVHSTAGMIVYAIKRGLYKP